MAPLAALVAMDGSDTPPASCLVAVAPGTPASLRRPPTPAALAAWATAWRLRVGGRPIAVGREPARGPRLSALVTDDVWGLSPMHPITRATSRAACSPSRAQADPPDADDRRARLVHPRDRRKAWRPEHAKPMPTTLAAIRTGAHALEPRGHTPAAEPRWAALPGAGTVDAARLTAALGPVRERGTTDAAWRGGSGVAL